MAGDDRAEAPRAPGQHHALPRSPRRAWRTSPHFDEARPPQSIAAEARIGDIDVIVCYFAHDDEVVITVQADRDDQSVLAQRDPAVSCRDLTPGSCCIT